MFDFFYFNGLEPSYIIGTIIITIYFVNLWKKEYNVRIFPKKITSEDILLYTITLTIIAFFELWACAELNGSISDAILMNMFLVTFVGFKYSVKYEGERRKRLKAKAYARMRRETKREMKMGW